MAVPLWKQYRYHLEWLCCAALAWAVPRLPRRGCLALARTLGRAAFYFDRRGREVALANLTLVFGDRYSVPERRRIALRSYQNFAQTMLDLFWGSRLNADNWRDYIEMTGNAENFFRAREDGTAPGAVAICIHWGNFEWASLGFGFRGINVMIVTETFKNERLSGLFSGARADSGHTIIPQEHSMIRLLKTVKRRGMAGMLADLTLRPDQPSVVIDAFGRKMCVTVLHAVLAQRAGAWLVPVHGEPLPDGRVRAVIDPPLQLAPGATLQEIAQACWSHFEPRIREHPELWMWAYKHWRYRPAAAAPEDYPPYANPQWQFEQMLTANVQSSKSV